jgi:hypothetical protein
VSQNEKVDYGAIIRENERTAHESNRRYQQMVTDYERQMNEMAVQAQIEVMRASQKVMEEILRPRARRITVAM